MVVEFDNSLYLCIVFKTEDSPIHENVSYD